MDLSDRQRKFAEFYAACGHATNAAIQAGYSERSAYSQGDRLLKNADIWALIESLQDESRKKRIANAIERQAFWSRVMRGEELEYNGKPARMPERLKASELLAKVQGDFREHDSDERSKNMPTRIVLVDGRDESGTASS